MDDNLCRHLCQCGIQLLSATYGRCWHLPPRPGPWLAPGCGAGATLVLPLPRVGVLMSSLLTHS